MQFCTTTTTTTTTAVNTLKWSPIRCTPEAPFGEQELYFSMASSTRKDRQLLLLLKKQQQQQLGDTSVTDVPVHRETAKSSRHKSETYVRK